MTNPIIDYMNSLSHEDSDRDLLPHLYGMKWYKWAWEFFTSTNPSNFLVSGNQTSKSSTMIRKCIMMATAPEIWKELWPRHEKPTQFWYFYPSKDVATTEFDQKWIKEFLPRGKMKDHPVFGWKEERSQYRKIYAIHFNSGVSVYFHSYEQRDTVLQASSVFAVFCDEELPEEMYDELYQRMSAVDGYFHLAFTATLGQRFWYETMEVKGRDERFKGALKLQVSKWDCLKYMDGSPSFWTPEKIRREEAACRNESERLKRIMGRFVLGSERLFPSFKNRVNKIKSPSLSEGNGIHYAAVYVSEDTGKAAIIVVRTNPDLSQGEVVKALYLPDSSISGLQIYSEFQDMAKGIEFAGCWCNPEGRDFIKISETRDPHFEEVRKPSDNAEKLINSLFHSKILKIAAGTKANKELEYQITMTRKDDDKLKDKELIAALVLVCNNIQWNFRSILGLISKKKSEPEMSDRMKFWKGLDRPELQIHDSVDRDIQELNAEVDGFDGLDYDHFN